MDNNINKYIIGDSLEVLKTFPDNFIDITICSPPYKDSDNFLDINFTALWLELYRAHKPNTLFYMNFGHLANFKERPFLVMLEALKAGWKLNETFTWLKTQYSPIQGKKRVNNLTEFIFLMYKGNMPNLDRLAVGVEYKDKSNLGRYSDIDLKCGGNHWVIPYETIQSKANKLHNDRFPLELPTRCIKLSGLKSGLAVDCFAGSGTTLVAAKKLGLNYIGIDKNPKYKEVFEIRVK